jgi:hypothetical protein
MEWGECKNVVTGDDGCQNLESSSNDPLLYGYFDCHKHGPKNDILDFGPCQKKHDGKYCGSQSYVGLQEIEKIALATCIIKTSIKNHLLLLFPLCDLK